MITMETKVSDSRRALIFIYLDPCLWNVAKISVSKHPGSILQTYKSTNFQILFKLPHSRCWMYWAYFYVDLCLGHVKKPQN